MTFEQLSRISSVRYFSAGRFAPLRGADGEADRRKSPLFSKGCPQDAISQSGTPPGATRRKHKHPQQVRKPHGLGQAEVTTGRWSGTAVPFAPATPNATERAVKVLTTVVALTVRMAFFARGRKNKTIHIKHNHALCTRLA